MAKRSGKRAARAAEKAAKKHPKLFAAVVVLLVIVLVAAACYYFFVYRPKHPDAPDDGTTVTTPDPDEGGTTPDLDEGGTTPDPDEGGTTPDPDEGGDGVTVVGGDVAEITSADLSIHFVAPAVKASGDCTLIKVGDTEVLIDAGPSKANTSEIVDYLGDYCTDGVIEYVIATHSDEDHIAGFVGSKSGGVRNGIFYSTEYTIGTLIQFDRVVTETSLYGEYCDAVEYIQEKGTQVYTGLQCYNNEDGAQRTYYLDEAQTISMNILYNYFYDHSAGDNNNNYSVCMLLSQKIDDEKTNHYLFTGDLEGEGEEYLVEYNDLPQVELFKAGHHGSKTSSTRELMDAIRPKYIAVCCCAGYNQYNAAEENVFPTQAFIDRVAPYTDKVYVTIMWDEETNGYKPMNGDIVFYYGKSEEESEKTLKLWCSNNSTILKDTEWFKENRTWNGA